MDTATTEIYTLSLHDALPISPRAGDEGGREFRAILLRTLGDLRSEEHTSELQSRPHLVCRLLLEKKNSTLRQGGLKPHARTPSVGAAAGGDGATGVPPEIPDC